MENSGQRGPPGRNPDKRIDSVVRVGPLTYIPAVLRGFGHEPEPVFESVGLKLVEFADPDTEISYLAASRLLGRCSTATGCEHFGLLVGTRAAPSVLGVAGFLLGTAPDVGTGLRGLVQHLGLQDQGGVPTLLIQGGVTLLGYAIQQPRAEAVDQIYDLSMAVACNIMRAVCGATWSPTEVLLSRRPPSDLTPYRQFFHAPLHFDADLSALAFPSRWLTHKVASADHLLHRHLEQEAEALHTARNANIVADVHRSLRKLLANRKCAVNDLARQLCMHQRTLNRRLREEGTSFRRELDKIRYVMARQLLEDSTMPIARIATTLCYADVTAFSRAFKRWTGITPAQWRAHNGSSA